MLKVGVLAAVHVVKSESKNASIVFFCVYNFFSTPLSLCASKVATEL